MAAGRAGPPPAVRHPPPRARAWGGAGDGWREGRGRPGEEVTLIVVTKTYPASDVRILSELGVRHVAEN
ncbi:hypothetical protein ABZ713_23395, partial [Streptomyces sp. NPDC006875]